MRRASLLPSLKAYISPTPTVWYSLSPSPSPPTNTPVSWNGTDFFFFFFFFSLGCVGGGGVWNPWNLFHSAVFTFQTVIDSPESWQWKHEVCSLLTPDPQWRRLGWGGSTKNSFVYFYPPSLPLKCSHTDKAYKILGYNTHTHTHTLF